MKVIKGKHCANCYYCRSKKDRAWCSKGKWIDTDYSMKIFTVDVRSLTALHYKYKAKECSDYQEMEG